MEAQPWLIAFDHATIAVHNVDDAVRRYEQLLDRPPRWRGEHPDLGTAGAIFALSNALIELVGPREVAPESEGLRKHLRARGEGLQSMAFLATDVGTLRAALAERGIRATEPQPGQARADDGTIRRYRTVDLSPRATRGLPVLIVERADVAEFRSREACPAGAVSALDHVVVRTADPNAAVVLYGEGLGVRLALDRRIDDRRMLFFRIGGVTIEVVEDTGGGVEDAFGGLAYRVADIDSANARMRAAGFDVSSVRDGAKVRTRVFTVRDGTCNVPTLVLTDPARE